MSAPQDRPDLPEAASTRTDAKAHPHSRVGGVWVSLVVAAVVFLLLLIFVLQNGQRVKVSFLGAEGTLPMGVALLLAAVIGILLVALPGTARIVQLRMSGRRGTEGSTSAPNPPAAAHRRS